MKPFAVICQYEPKKFKRETGLSIAGFSALVNKVVAHIESQKQNRPLSRRGKQVSKLSQQDRVLLTIYYLRHYPTLSNLGDVFDLSESYTCKIYHRYARMLAQIEKLDNRKNLLEQAPQMIIIDVSEQPIERPVKRQQDYYSGKKRHTIKAQLIIFASKLTILSVVLSKGRQHDFSIFKASRVLLHRESTLLADSGYQGIEAYHKQSSIPIKKKKGQRLTVEEKAYNKALSKQRILIENVNRRCKIFKITKDVYRGKHKHYSLTWNLVAALVNARYDCI